MESYWKGLRALAPGIAIAALSLIVFAGLSGRDGSGTFLLVPAASADDHSSSSSHTGGHKGGSKGGHAGSHDSKSGKGRGKGPGIATRGIPGGGKIEDKIFRGRGPKSGSHETGDDHHESDEDSHVASDDTHHSDKGPGHDPSTDEHSHDEPSHDADTTTHTIQ